MMLGNSKFLFEISKSLELLIKNQIIILNYFFLYYHPLIFIFLYIFMKMYADYIIKVKPFYYHHYLSTDVFIFCNTNKIQILRLFDRIE